MKSTAKTTRLAPTRATTVKVAPTAPLFPIKPLLEELRLSECSDVVWGSSTEADWATTKVDANDAVVPGAKSVRVFTTTLVFALEVVPTVLEVVLVGVEEFEVEVVVTVVVGATLVVGDGVLWM